MDNAKSQPIPRNRVLDIDAYVPGKSIAPKGVTLYKLSSNESALGPSPKARAAFKSASETLELYPDGSAINLRAAIARAHNLDPERIICGNGSDDLLHLLAGAYIGPQDEGIFTEHGFLVYKIAILAAGGVPVIAKEVACTASVDEILSCVTERTKIVYLANPNNPTGTYLSSLDVRRLHANLAPSILLVLDAAYGEYVEAEGYTDGLGLAMAHENVVVTHTFSKIHGLASLRIGWAYGSRAMCDALNRIRGPFNVNGAALLAGVASIEDVTHIARAREHNAQWLKWLSGEISKLGLVVTPSVANFVLIHFPEIPGQTAADADGFLTDRGIIVRGVASYGLPGALRITVGNAEANNLVVEYLSAFLQSVTQPTGQRDA